MRVYCWLIEYPSHSVLEDLWLEPLQLLSLNYNAALDCLLFGVTSVFCALVSFSQADSGSDGARNLVEVFRVLQSRGGEGG